MTNCFACKYFDAGLCVLQMRKVGVSEWYIPCEDGETAFEPDMSGMSDLAPPVYVGGKKCLTMLSMYSRLFMQLRKVDMVEVCDANKKVYRVSKRKSNYCV